MALEWTKKGNGHVGQFSFRIPSAPLYPGQPFIRSVNDVLREKGHVEQIRVQTQNQVLFEGTVTEQRFEDCTRVVRNIWPGMSFDLMNPPVPRLRGSLRYVVVTATGGRSVWSAYLSQDQINRFVACLRGVDSATLWWGTPSNRMLRGTPNTLGDVAAGVSVGGGLLGLAVLALAGYGIYRLVK
jgi:hypothetical protein